MAFTKIAAAGIGSTETVTLHSLEVLNNATVGGVLTYEDVTNVDSIGIITARAGVLVGSGITLSKDGDIFATGVTTATKFVGDGSGLTGVASTDNIRTNTNATFLQNINVSGTSTVAGDVNIADKIVHIGDTNTAIRFPEADKVTVETSGTERLAIEPAGNVNARKSVNVAIGLTVGAATSTSTFIGQGSLELTRSDGASHIDFKNAFADDFDSRIITNAANQLQFFTGGQGATLCALQTGTGKVAIATDTSPSLSKLQIHSDKLGGTAGNSQELLYLRSPDVSNVTSYRFTNYRHTNGTSHTSSEGRLRRHVDSTDMGFVGFGDGYVNFGYGTAEKARINSSGYITVPSQPYAMLGLTANLAVPYNTAYEVIFNSVMYDTASAYNSSNGRYTCPVVGDYLVTFDCQYTGMVNAFHLGVGVNGTNPPGGTNFDLWNHTGDNVRGDNIARVIRITATTQYISFFTYTNTNSAFLEPNRTKATIKFLG